MVEDHIGAGKRWGVGGGHLLPEAVSSSSLLLALLMSWGESSPPSLSSPSSFWYIRPGFALPLFPLLLIHQSWCLAGSLSPSSLLLVQFKSALWVCPDINLCWQSNEQKIKCGIIDVSLASVVVLSLPPPLMLYRFRVGMAPYTANFQTNPRHIEKEGLIDSGIHSPLFAITSKHPSPWILIDTSHSQLWC